MTLSYFGIWSTLALFTTLTLGYIIVSVTFSSRNVLNTLYPVGIAYGVTTWLAWPAGSGELSDSAMLAIGVLSTGYFLEGGRLLQEARVFSRGLDEPTQSILLKVLFEVLVPLIFPSVQSWFGSSSGDTIEDRAESLSTERVSRNISR